HTRHSIVDALEHLVKALGRLLKVLHNTRQSLCLLLIGEQARKVTLPRFGLFEKAPYGRSALTHILAESVLSQRAAGLFQVRQYGSRLLAHLLDLGKQPSSLLGRDD